MAVNDVIKFFDEKKQHPVNIELKKTFHKRLIKIAFKFLFVDLVFFALAIALFFIIGQQFGGNEVCLVFNEIHVEKLDLAEHDVFFGTFFAIEHFAFILFLFLGLISFGITIILICAASIAFIYRRWVKRSSLIYDANNGTTTGSSFHEDIK